jgi:hypothetical protein
MSRIQSIRFDEGTSAFADHIRASRIISRDDACPSVESDGSRPVGELLDQHDALFDQELGCGQITWPEAAGHAADGICDACGIRGEAYGFHFARRTIAEGASGLITN